jgi:hypothetical protein
MVQGSTDPRPPIYLRGVTSRIPPLRAPPCNSYRAYPLSALQYTVAVQTETYHLEVPDGLLGSTQHGYHQIPGYARYGVATPDIGI